MSYLMKSLKNRLNSRGGFLKSVAILAGGTAFAQALAVIVLPVITRIYSPEDFSLFAVYSSILSILSVVICLRFEIAIPLPEKDEDALSLFSLALLSNIILTLFIVLSICLFQSSILELIHQPKLGSYLWLIPIGVFFSGIYNALQYWTTRGKKFSTIAKTKVTQSLTSSSVQVGGGYLELGVLALILGQIANASTGIIRLILVFYKDTTALIQEISLDRLKKNLIKYSKFPKYSTFESLSNIGAMQFPLIIIAAVAVGPKAGYLMLAMKVMAIPMSLIGSAIAQVYLAHAPDHHHKGDLYKYTIHTIKEIAKFAIVPLISIGLIAPFVFPFIFGNSWTTAGDMVIWMIPWFVMQILSSPVSMSLHITGNQGIALALQVIGLILRVGCLFLVSAFYSALVFEYYAISGFLFYTLYLIIILMVLKYRL